MSDYTKTTNFAAKDSLPSGNSGKIVKGSEIDTEFNNIQTAVATKLNINNSALTGSTSVQTLAVTGVLTTTAATVHTNGITMPDNAKAIFGTGSDLEIYHDGSNSIISDQGTGNLVLRAGDFRLKNADSSETMILAAANGAVQLYYDNAAKLTTSSTGTDVTGTVTADGLTVDGTAVITTNGNTTQLTLKSTDADASVGPRLDLTRDSASPAADDTIGVLRFLGNDSAGGSFSYALMQGFIEDPTDGSEDGKLVIETRLAGSNRERISMDATELVINESSQDLDFRVESNPNTHALFVEGSSSNVGIGTSSPAEPLHVQEGSSGITSKAGTIILVDGSGSSRLSIASGTTSTGELLFGSSADNDAGRIVYDHSNDQLQLWANGLRAVDIDSLGNVGIGITTPNEPLHIFNATRNVLVNIESGDSGAYISFKDNDTTDTDTVFIGAVDNDLKLYAGGSTERLAIMGSNGTIQTRTAGSNNVRLGLDAGGNIGGSGDFNTLIGDSAGAAITTGDSNVAVGFEALATEDAHGRNVAIGYRALAVLNAGANANNTVVGYGAGVAMTDGVQNTLVGSLAGDAITTGDYNVSIGYGSLSKETTAHRSVAVGTLALQNQNGFAGTAYNTAVGYNAGNDITTGARNTCVGAISGDAMTTGTNNTFIGYNTGGTGVVTGADNTALGISAGASLTSGSNNVLIGHDAGVSGSPGGNLNNESNEIVIGDDAITQAHVQVDWTVASDQRDKTDFVDLDLGLDFVKALEPVTYYWDKRSKYGDKYTTNEEGDLVLNEDYDLDDFTPDGTHKEDWMDIGFKAQAVQALEEAAGYTTAAKKNLTVSTTADGKQMGLQYSKFVPILVKAIQDQDAIITALTARIEQLENN